MRISLVKVSSPANSPAKILKIQESETKYNQFIENFDQKVSMIFHQESDEKPQSDHTQEQIITLKKLKE